jgi:hypothetical protein
MAHWGGRIIDTDTLRIPLVLQVSSDDQQHEQGSEDNNPVNAHQSGPAAAWPLNNLASRHVYAQHFKRLMSRLIANLHTTAPPHARTHSSNAVVSAVDFV